MATKYPKHKQFDLSGMELIVDKIAAKGTGTGIDSAQPIQITWTAANPNITPNGAVTIANGGTPTVLELQEFCVELNAKLNALLTAS